jgi:hypothetical protein
LLADLAEIVAKLLESVRFHLAALAIPKTQGNNRPSAMRVTFMPGSPKNCYILAVVRDDAFLVIQHFINGPDGILFVVLGKDRELSFVPVFLDIVNGLEEPTICRRVDIFGPWPRIPAAGIRHEGARTESQDEQPG